MMDTLGNNLRQCREGLGLSLRDVSKRLHVSHVFIGEVERGTRNLPVKHFPKIAKILKIDVEYLEKWDERNFCPTCERRFPMYAIHQATQDEKEKP